MYNKDFFKYESNYLRLYELKELGINKTFSTVRILEYYASYLVYISSSLEKNLVNKDARYREFSNISDINNTQSLFLKSLHKYRKTPEKLEILSELLNRKTITWELKGYLKLIGTITNDDYKIFILENENDINIFNFLRTIKKIETSENPNLIDINLDEVEMKVFNAINRSEVFLNLYDNYNVSRRNLFQSIKSSKVLNKIEDFINQKNIAPDIERHFNIRIPVTEEDTWEFLFTDINELSEFDVNVILLLEDLNLINLTVTCNNVPLTYMSSGEQSIIRLFSYFADIPSKENLLVFFDEPENTLHPKWQQNFPIYFKRIVEEIYEIKKSHFIFSTHSPLIIMKSTSLSNSNVVRFYKDNQDKFQSHQISNINSFSIEEVLLDEFKIAYRDQEIEINVNNILSDRNDKIRENNDPIYSIQKSFELKNKINELFNSLKSEQ